MKKWVYGSVVVVEIWSLNPLLASCQGVFFGLAFNVYGGYRVFFLSKRQGRITSGFLIPGLLTMTGTDQKNQFSMILPLPMFFFLKNGAPILFWFHVGSLAQFSHRWMLIFFGIVVGADAFNGCYVRCIPALSSSLLLSTFSYSKRFCAVFDRRDSLGAGNGSSARWRGFSQAISLSLVVLFAVWWGFFNRWHALTSFGLVMAQVSYWGYEFIAYFLFWFSFPLWCSYFNH